MTSPPAYCLARSAARRLKEAECLSMMSNASSIPHHRHAPGRLSRLQGLDVIGIPCASFRAVSYVVHAFPEKRNRAGGRGKKACSGGGTRVEQKMEHI